jgi:hypothetical protein
MFSEVAGAAREVSPSAQTLLEASEAVASIAANLRGEVEEVPRQGSGLTTPYTVQGNSCGIS